MSDNSPSSGVDTVEKGIKSITSLTKGLTEFLRWVAGMIRNRDWVGLLMFAIAVFLVFWGTKLTLGTMVKQPIFYGIWGILGVMFLVGLILELRTKPPIKHIYRDTAKRKAIKFLSSFEEEDAEIYARLQGYRDLRVIRENLVRPEFSFGVLKGKSGCGKSSYVKAGLLAGLNKTETYRGVYIKFSDSDSLETVKDAFVNSLSLENEDVEHLNFIQLLKKGINAASESCEEFKCLILVFDQFEQFFVYTDNQRRRNHFIQELVNWYEDDELTEQVKILVSIREDWFARLDEIQEALNYSLRIGSQSGGNSFYIKNFSPEESTMILSVMAQEDLAIAENDKQGFERDYIQEVLEKELASVSDGLISPVDLQIIAETIKQQNTSAMRAFNQTVFQKLGGIEGLRRSFLESMLEPLGEERKKSAVQMLVALTNLEQQTRSQVQALEQLQEKVKATITAKEVEKIVIYLQETGLITIAEKEGIKGFELSHEGMISAVIRLGEKIQDQAYRANQLLERRVNEWLGNRRSSRYYFNFREIWLIERQKPYLIWGKKRQQKQTLLQKSKQKIYAVLGVVGSIIFIVIGVWSWLNYTTTGMMTQMRWKLSNVSEKISDPQYQAKAVIAFAKDGNFERALQLSDKMNNSSEKANALRAIAETYHKLKQPEKAVALLEKALSAADTIDSSRDKAYALRDISESVANLKQWKLALKAYQECPGDDCEVETLATILTIYAEQEKEE
ncbi:MAG: tetratricopeptide repeat protein [Crocosphaera sp.]